MALYTDTYTKLQMGRTDLEKARLSSLLGGLIFHRQCALYLPAFFLRICKTLCALQEYGGDDFGLKLLSSVKQSLTAA